VDGQTPDPTAAHIVCGPGFGSKVGTGWWWGGQQPECGVQASQLEGPWQMPVSRAAHVVCGALALEARWVPDGGQQPECGVQASQSVVCRLAGWSEQGRWLTPLQHMLCVALALGARRVRECRLGSCIADVSPHCSTCCVWAQIWEQGGGWMVTILHSVQPPECGVQASRLGVSMADGR
jgi:hypothetical protein